MASFEKPLCYSVIIVELFFFLAKDRSTLVAWFALSWRRWSNLLNFLRLVSLFFGLASSQLDKLHHERRCTGMPEPDAMFHQHCDQLANRWWSLDATSVCHRWCTIHGMECRFPRRELHSHGKFWMICQPTMGCSIHLNRLACVVYWSMPNGWNGYPLSNQWVRNQFYGILQRDPKKRWFPLGKRTYWKWNKRWSKWLKVKI